MVEVCISVEAWLYIKMCMIWPRCASVWRPDCISKYYDMVEVCLSVEAWLYIEVLRYGRGVPQCGGLIVYQNVYNMAEVRLSVEAWLYIKMCTIWPRCALVWRPDCISKYVRYRWGVPQCVSKYVRYGWVVSLWGGQIVYQRLYDKAYMCLSVTAWLYLKLCTIRMGCVSFLRPDWYQSMYVWPRCASVWRPDCISKYEKYSQSVPMFGGLIVYKNMYHMAEVCLSVKAWLYIKVCTILQRCALVWKPDCMSKYVRYGRGVVQWGGLIVYQSMHNIAKINLSVAAWLYIKVCMIWRRCQGSKIVLVRSYLRVSQAAGQVNILIFLLKIKFSPCMPIHFVIQSKWLFSDISRPGCASVRRPDSKLNYVQYGLGVP